MLATPKGLSEEAQKQVQAVEHRMLDTIGRADPRKGGDPSWAAFKKTMDARPAPSDPSVALHNDYVERLKNHILGYVTYVGTEGGGDPVHQFKSVSGENRLLNRFISEPLYFEEDWAKYAQQSKVRSPTFLVSDKPLNAALLARRLELRDRKRFPLNELRNIARDDGVKGFEGLSAEPLAEAILQVEFPEG